MVGDIPECEKPRFLLSKTVLIRHRVRSGESLNSIASKYDVPVSRIISYNRLNSQKALVVGKRLTIPIIKEKRYAKGKSRQKNYKIQISSGQYKVKRGDTLQMIARRSGTTEAQIKELNNLKSDTIRVGQVLKVSLNDKARTSTAKNDKNENIAVTTQKSKIKNKILSAEDIDKLGTNKYIVIRGDNLYSIARKNNINVTKLMELNNLARNETITPGQILVVK